MISDTERREIAQKLRAEALAWSESYPGTQLDMDEVEAIFYELARFASISGVTYPELIYTRFADLIDRPTCTIDGNYQLITPGLGELDLDDMCCFELSCGHEVYGYEKPKYCAECGTVITDD